MRSVRFGAWRGHRDERDEMRDGTWKALRPGNVFSLWAGSAPSMVVNTTSLCRLARARSTRPFD